MYFGNGLRGLRVSQEHNNFEKVKKHDWCYQLVFEFQNKCPSFLFLIGLPPWCPISLQNFMNILRTDPEKQNCRNFAGKNTLFWSQWTLIFSKTQFCQIFTVVMILTTCKISVKLLKWILRKPADTHTGFSFIFATSNRQTVTTQFWILLKILENQVFFYAKKRYFWILSKFFLHYYY